MVVVDHSSYVLDRTYRHRRLQAIRRWLRRPGVGVDLAIVCPPGCVGCAAEGSRDATAEKIREAVA